MHHDGKSAQTLTAHMATPKKIIQGSLFEDDYLVKSLGNIVRDAEYALTELVATLGMREPQRSTSLCHHNLAG